MQIKMRKIYLLILTVSLCLFSLNSAVFAGENNTSCTPGDKKACAAAEACKPAANGGKITTSDNKINGKCVKDKTAGGCYNSNPTSCSVNYSGLKYRAKGAGGNKTARNHLGSDIGSAGCPNQTNINVYAPAKGKVVFTGVGTCSGRSMVIEHDNKCSGGKFRTIFRHLIEYKKEMGDEVDPGDIVGIEGGSNASGRQKKDICDNTAQSNYPSYTRSGCGRTVKCYSGPLKEYAIHLHMETADGELVGSSSAAGGIKKVMKSYCGGIQALCGGCPVDLTSCGGNSELSNDGTTATVDGITGGGSGGGDGDGSYNNDKCDFQDYLDSENCTFCELFKSLFNVASTMAKVANVKLAGPTKTLVSLGFLIWLCIYLLRHVTSYAKISTGEMLKGILFQGFRVAVVIIALSGAIYEILDLTLNPVMETGLEFAQSLNKNSSCDSSASYMQNIIGYDEKTGFPKANDASSEQIGGLSKHIGESIICSLKNLEDSTGFLLSLGKYSICLGWERHPLFSKDFIASLGYLSTGCCLWIVGILLLLSFPWCLVDCILQLSIAVSLLPCAVGAYAFKVTAQYFKMVWNIFMNAVFNFVFMAIVIYIIMTNLSAWIGYTPGTAPDEKIFITALQPNGIAWWGIGFLKILVVCLFCWTFFDEAKNMSDEFSKGLSMHNLGRKVGGTVASAALYKGIEPAAQMTGKAIGSTMAMAGRGINREFGGSARNLINKGQYKVLKFFGAKETTNPDGTTSVSSSFNFMGTKHSRTFTKDGDNKYTQTSQTHRRSNYEKYFNVNTDKDGNVNVTARKSFMGMTMFGLLGKQTMKEEKDPTTGRTIWRTADKDASRQRELVIDDDGNIKFNKYANLDDKNIFTQAMHHRSGIDHAGIQKGTTKVQNDNVLKMKEMLDDNGNLIGRHLEFRNVVGGIIKEDGTTNLQNMNYLIQNSSNKEHAYEALIIAHMQQRKMTLSETFNNRTVTVNKDQSVTIMQTNNDGSRQEITAKIDGNQMILHEKTFDSAGNPIRYQKNNGIQSLTEVYSQQRDGTYTVTTKQDFAEFYKQNRTAPLNTNGVWGYKINRDKAMKGFTQQNFDEHVEQLKSKHNTLKFTDFTRDDVLTRMKK